MALAALGLDAEKVGQHPRKRPGQVADGASLMPLRLDRVSYAAGGATLVHEISVRIDGGKRTVVLGPNGAGKSLLLRLIHGLIEPTSGAILWGGGAHPLAPEAARARQAMVFQRPVMLMRSALANVEYALAVRGCPRHERRERACEALGRFGLDRVANRYARLLSGGEQQRVALARAWAVGPDLLLLDEPTSSLDPAAARAVEMAIDAFHAAGITTILTTHDLGQARRLADDVLFLCGGRLIEQATAPRFFARPASREAAAFIRGEIVT